MSQRDLPKAFLRNLRDRKLFADFRLQTTDFFINGIQMEKNRITILLALILVVGKINAQTAPNGYTPNFRFRMWAQGANPSADSLNANWKDIDHQIYKRGWTLGSSKIYPTVPGWKTYFRTNAADTTNTDLVNIEGNASVGSSSTSALFTQSYNSIVAPVPGAVANAVTGILLINNAPATSVAWNNSPALQLKQFSWNPTALANQENSWYLHNWGFRTPGDAGGVFVVTNKRPSGPNTYSSFVIDELGRTLIGYNKSHGFNYYGFWGEDLGSWGVILAHSLPVTVGWPENSITTDFYVTGNSKFTGNVGIGTVASTKLHVASSSNQLRLEWGASQYLNFSVDANGLTTLSGAGSAPGITTSLPVTVAGLLKTTYQSLVIDPGNSNATVDVKGGNGLNVAMVTYVGGIPSWLVGNHAGNNFSIYSYALDQDRFTISNITGAITTGLWQATSIDTSYVQAVSNVVAAAPLSVATSGRTKFLSIANIADSFLQTISTAGKVSGNAITSGTIGGSTAWNTSGDITSAGNVSITKSSTGVPTLKVTHDSNSSSERAVQIFSQGAERAYWASNGDIYIKIPRFNGRNTMGTGSASLGANSPAVTTSAPYTWIQVTTADGSTAYIPAWK